MDTAVAATVPLVVVVVSLEDFESSYVFWIGFGEVGNRGGAILCIFLRRILHSRRIAFCFWVKV